MLSRFTMLFVATMVFATTASADPTYSFQSLPGIGSFDAWGLSVNNDGETSGWQFEPDADHAGIWSLDGTFQDIGRVDGRRMFGRGNNNLGDMVGFSRAPGQNFPFRWTGGAPVELANDGGGVALGINDAGTVSGTNEIGGVNYATMWLADGTKVDIGAGAGSFGGLINQHGHMTGGTATFQPFRYDGAFTFLTPLAGDIDGIARGINDHDVVVGNSGFPTTRAVKWDASGAPTELAALVAGDSDAWDINNAGYVVGVNGPQAILWLPDGTPFDLMAFLPTGTAFASATSISDTGYISGLYVDPATGYVQGFRLDPVPEPSSLALVLLAATGGLVWRRRRGSIVRTPRA